MDLLTRLIPCGYALSLNVCDTESAESRLSGRAAYAPDSNVKTTSGTLFAIAAFTYGYTYDFAYEIFHDETYTPISPAQQNCGPCSEGGMLERGVALTWVYLKGSQALFRSRLPQRTSHFMKADMLASQFDALEEPSNAMVIDAAAPPDEIVDTILRSIRSRRSLGAT